MDILLIRLLICANMIDIIVLVLLYYCLIIVICWYYCWYESYINITNITAILLVLVYYGWNVCSMLVASTGGWAQDLQLTRLTLYHWAIEAWLVVFILLISLILLMLLILSILLLVSLLVLLSYCWYHWYYWYGYGDNLDIFYYWNSIILLL